MRDFNEQNATAAVLGLGNPFYVAEHEFILTLMR